MMPPPFARLGRLARLAIVVLALHGGLTHAEESTSAWTSQGELGVESRVFRDDGSPLTEDRALGMLGRLELRHARGVFQEKARGFGRLDTFDRERTVLFAEEAWAQAEGEHFRLRVGVDVINWTAMEAFHPTDVINARNLDSDLENLEKIGEPMAAVQIRAREGMTVTAMVMPVYMETRFPSPRSRLNFGPPGVDLRGRRRLLDRNGSLVDRNFGPQAALQVRQVLGSADVTLHVLEHMDRLQPLALLDPATMQITLLYQTVRQAGATYQQVLGPIIAKLEGTYRWFVEPSPTTTAQLGLLPQRNHGTIAAGFEYGHPHANGSESTFFVEGQTILGVNQETRLALSPFQRDLFLGWRFARNDEASKELLLATIVDLERRGEYLVNASYKQRLGDTWTVVLGLRLFQARAVAPLAARGLEIIENGDHIRLALTRHF